MALTELGADWHPRIVRVLTELSVPPALHESALPQLCRFLDLVVTWNARTDLTAARSADELVDLFVADAAVLAASAPASDGETWLDVGSGAGAPGLPLALLRPELQVTL